MYPILFHAFGVPLYTQTVLTALAFMVGLWLAGREARRFTLPHEAVVNVAIVAFLGAIIGARLFFLFVFQQSSSWELKELCSLRALDGGLSFHGALLGGALSGSWLAYRSKIPLRRLADVFAPSLALAMFFMRLGCLFNGCDYGLATTAPWGIRLPGTLPYPILRHPLQLYEGLPSLLLILPVLMACNRKALRPGSTFVCYLFLSGLLRFLVDFYRDEPSRISDELLVTQYLAGALLLGSGIIISLTFLKTHNDPLKPKA